MKSLDFKNPFTRQAVTCIALGLAVPCFGQTVMPNGLTVNGTITSTLNTGLTVNGASILSGNLTVNGWIDSNNNQFSLGLLAGSFSTWIYNDSATDTLNNVLNRTAASWLWAHGTVGAPVPAMRLNSAHQLVVYRDNGTTAGITFDPGTVVSPTSTLSLGTATLSATGGVLTANGNMNFIGADGSLSLSSSGVALSAVGVGKNITFTTPVSGGGDILFNTNGLERARIRSSGKVGVGTNNPTVKLDVRGASASADATIQLVGTGVSALMLGQDADGGVIRGQGGNSHLRFLVGGSGDQAAAGSGTEALRIVSSGFVGVGTAGPDTRLSVRGENMEISLGRGQTDISGYGRIGFNSAFEQYLTNNAFFNGSAWNYVNPGAYGATSTRFMNSSGVFRFDTSSGGTTPAWNTRLWIANNGYIGIGTGSSAPSYLLHVNGQGKSNSWVIADPLYAGSMMLGVGANYEPTLSSDTNLFLLAGGGANLIQKVGSIEVMRATAAGNVGIGTTNPGTYKLAVNGLIHAQGIVIDTSGWSDYVFDKDYRLAPLSEVESHIKEHKHLPGIPSAAEVAEHGVSLGDMQSKLLAKVEELTLHLIAQEKQLNAQASRIEQLEQDNSALRNR